MGKTSFVGHRKAYIDAANADGTYDIVYFDDNSNNPIKGVQAVNLGSFGSGVFNKYHVGAPVWIGQSYYFQPLIVGFADITGSIEQGNVLETNDIDAPKVQSGEIVIQASSGAHIDLRQSGDIKISNLQNDGLFLSDSHRALLVNSFQYYNLNESGYTIEGRVRRYHPSYLPQKNQVFVDLLNDPEADSFTVDVARDPTQKATPMNRARGVTNITRNPSFAEKRELILEFADSFFVRDSQTELNLASEFPKTLSEMQRSVAVRRGFGVDEQTFDNLRHSTRTNVLKLDTNVIIERVQGTLVDVFGNVLDINYNKLNLPTIIDGGKGSITAAHSLLNRSVAYHFQVNSRNSLSTASTGSGKFTFDVDKEGQFKLNVPRSSNAGTVSIISSFTNTDTDLDSRTDVSNISLSASGISAPTGGDAGTAFHDMTIAADRLIKRTIRAINPITEHSNTTQILSDTDTPSIEFLITDTTTSTTIPSYTTTLSVQPGPSAISPTIDSQHIGGRSGLINFEGSLEMSLGKDEIDNKSLMLDTAGSFIGWLGMDNKKRSAVVNTDGEVILNIGDYVSDMSGKMIFNQGSLTIRVNLVDIQSPDVGDLETETTADIENSDHIIHLSPKGIVISSGNGTPVVIRSSGDLNLEAAGSIDMKAREIRVDSGYVRKIMPKKGDI